MEKIINLHIEKLPEGYYLATTDDIQGLVVQGKTIAETLEIARDVAQKLLESQTDTTLSPIAESFDYPLVVGQ
jgi:predicted RNase H-like HicB family nuclease